MADEVGLGVIGGGLMGREITSAVARWIHLDDLGVTPRVVHVCDLNPDVLRWYRGMKVSTDYKELLADPAVDAVYCAVPHHLHEEIYLDVLRAGKHLLAEKPFGIDLAAANAIMAEVDARPQQLVRVSSEFPFSPGGQAVWKWIADRSYGELIEVRASFLHASDLDPNKPINWKRQSQFNGAYGCMGDLGMHALHLPLRAGWIPATVFALLSSVFDERPDGRGGVAACDTWDNATLACSLADGTPMVVETKRIAPGETNTWRIEIDGTAGSIAYSTKYPKTLRWLDYKPGAQQAWSSLDLGSVAAYPGITGAIFETGFSDWLQQMLAAFLDELSGEMHQPFTCVTPAEALAAHRIYTAALESQATRSAVTI